MILTIGISLILSVSSCTDYKDGGLLLKVDELTRHTLQQLKACEGASLLDRESKVNIGRVQMGAKMVNNRSDDSIIKMDSWNLSKLWSWAF